MKARRTLAGICLCLFLSLGLCACGYQVMGGGRAVGLTPIGDGQKVLQIAPVEHVALYPWLDSYVRSLVRDEMRLRMLGRFTDSQSPDYLLEIRVPLIQTTMTGAFSQDSLLLSAEIRLEILIFDARDNAVIWRSSTISATEPIHEGREQTAVRSALAKAVNGALDLLQQSF